MGAFKVLDHAYGTFYDEYFFSINLIITKFAGYDLTRHTVHTRSSIQTYDYYQNSFLARLAKLALQVARTLICRQYAYLHRHFAQKGLKTIN